MPPRKAPGVFVEEMRSRLRTIERAATSTAAMVGVTDRGPVATPTLVTSMADFARSFGAPLAAGAPPNLTHLPHAARGFFANGGKRLFIVRVAGPAATTSTADLTGPAPNDATVLRVHACAPGAWGNTLRIRTATATAATFDLSVERLEGAVVAESEHFPALSLDPDDPRYAPAIVGSLDRPSAAGASQLIRLAEPSGGLLHDAAEWQLSGGNDDLSGVTDATIIDGIGALASEPDISLVAAPGITAPAIQQALLDHAKRMRFRFAVLDTPASASVTEAIGHRHRFDSSYGALYHPWIVTADVPTGVPPSGHVMGVIARSDSERGVWKAPANEAVADATGFTATLTHGEQQVLNPAHVNALRDFRSVNRGLRLYGARTLSTDPEWRYVNLRRLLLHIEQSLDTGLQWTVFEPNAEPLWAAVRTAAATFLTTLWRAGGLVGTTPREAFFVQAGLGQTMTQADVDAGRLTLVLGAAPAKPAEFTVIRLTLPAQRPG